MVQGISDWVKTPPEIYQTTFKQTLMDVAMVGGGGYPEPMEGRMVTIADLDGSMAVQSIHLAEAVNQRSLDRKEWGGSNTDQMGPFIS